MTNRRRVNGLGRGQQIVLASLVRHGEWHNDKGWQYESRFRTTQILDGFVTRGLAKHELVERTDHRGIKHLRSLYTVTEAGKHLLAQSKR